ncbi:hypothetical protein [Flavobacterium sp.]|uniref:hypothetical protein n=1 Tax=Flavobacterium sp. TaxID=239 RepID=UPI0025C6916D|nr:hypothetical protein [Flavobacterium sp.]
MGKVKTGYIKEYNTPPKSDAKNAEFLVYFRETSSYNGGFGIDYMSGEPQRFKNDGSEIRYKNTIESGNWADFEKLYNPSKIYNLPYYSSWISMYKDNFTVTGEQVKLTLYVDKGSGNWDNKGIIDEIVMAPKDGLSFVPDRLPAKTAHEKEITVFCNTELTGDYLYEVKDQNGNVIGLLNFCKNNSSQQKKINVRLVNVKLFGVETFSTNLVQIQKWLAKEGLNQAMINANFSTAVEELDLSLPKYAAAINSTRTVSGRIQDYISNYDLLLETIEKNDTSGNTKVLTYYFINKDAVDGGYDPETGAPKGWLNGMGSPSPKKSVLIFNKTNSLGYKKGTIVHEGLHTMGLPHFFNNGPGFGNGKFYFKKWETDNIMDYYKAGTSDKRTRIIKWQWDEIRKDKTLL